MKAYKSNYKYPLALFILLFFSGFIFVSSGIWNFKNISAFSILAIVTLVAVWSLFFLCLPKEITIRDNVIEFKTLVINKAINFSEIESITPYYSTKSKMWHGGSEEKSSMLCIIQLKGNLFKLFVLTDAITDYKELYRTIKAKLDVSSDTGKPVS